MIDGKRVLAVVPARGGSKGIPLKNLRHVCGEPIVARAGRCLAQVPLIDRAVVSTDHEGIAKIAEKAGLAAPFRRPPELSGDLVGDWNVLNHALLKMDRLDGYIYDIVVMLQPTAPLRTPQQVTAAIKHLVEGHFDSVWTVTVTDLKYHPLKQLALKEGNLHHFDPRGAGIIARQQLDPVYHRNGLAYVMTRACIVEQETILGNRAGALITEGPSVSIDVPSDIEAVESTLKARKSRFRV